MREIFNAITERITTAIQGRYDSFVEFAPFILGALAMFVLGLVLAELAARATMRIFKRIKFEVIADKIGLKNFLERTSSKMSSSHAVAKSVKAYLIFLFFIESTKIAKLTEVAEFLTSVIGYVPQVIIALFIILVGIRIGGTLQAVVSTSLYFARNSVANAMGVAAKSTVVGFAVLAALSQLEIAEILVQILFIGFISMLALAGGLAFGLGGKDLVKEVLEAFKNMELIEFMEEQKKKKAEEGGEVSK